MTKQCLNGVWKYRVGKGCFKDINVPFSSAPVGHSECIKCFDLECIAPKTFLRIEGITYSARVTLNGDYLGEMLPYCEYTFDVTNIVLLKNNKLIIELEDINADYGPTDGWENFGGIIRDVNLLYVNECYIKDVFFKTRFINGYKTAEMCVETECDLAANVQAYYEITLLYDENVVAKYTQLPHKKAKWVLIDDVMVWSTDNPALYRLEVRLIVNGAEFDFYDCNVGFRELVCDRHRFVLNGNPIFLKGVCKHEMYGDSGHCPSYEQMLDDMQKIKSIGCNFVRLVHYPHNKAILDIADRLGLIVSEEPGLWWADTANEKIKNGSLEVLKRTILRDRNHCSIGFWLCFNECPFNEEFLMESAALCRNYDDTRLVSGANCLNNEDTKKFFNLCGYDFYTMHPYSNTFDRALEVSKVLNDKPLLFTEWGGGFVYNNPKLFSEFLKKMYELYIDASDDGAVAGASYWYWAEVNDYNRGAPDCVDGTLCEGLLDSERHPTMIYDAFVQTLACLGEEAKFDFWLKKCDDTNITFDNPLVCDNISDDFKDALKEAVDYENTYKIRKRVITNGPICDIEYNGFYQTPIVIANNSTVTFTAGCLANKITVLGMVSMRKGYPISGEYGECACELILHYISGKRESIEIRNGKEFTTVYTTLGSSSIKPIAEVAKPYAEFGYDKNYENYILNSFDIISEPDEELEKITFVSSNKGYDLLIYGIFIQG